MDVHNFIDTYFQEIKQSLDSLDKKQIEKAVDLLTNAYINNKNIFILGNGGSASTASHMACDLGKGTLQQIYDNTEKRLHVISLTDNVAIMTAYGNDLSFDDIFVQQLKNLIGKDDVVIAISGSGNSKNVLKAIEYANSCKAKTIGFLGFQTGGKAAKLVTVPIIVVSKNYGPIEDIHGILNHVIASWIAKIKYMYDGKKRVESTNTAVPFK